MAGGGRTTRNTAAEPVAGQGAAAAAVVPMMCLTEHQAASCHDIQGFDFADCLSQCSVRVAFLLWQTCMPTQS